MNSRRVCVWFTRQVLRTASLCVADVYVTLRWHRRWRQERRRAGVRDADTQVDHTALRLAARRTSTNHLLRSRRNWKNFPRAPTSRISRSTVSCIFLNRRNLILTAEIFSVVLVIVRLKCIFSWTVELSKNSWNKVVNRFHRLYFHRFFCSTVFRF